MNASDRSENFLIAAMGRHGEGIGHGGRGPIYVPFVLPGERVKAQVRDRRGRLVEVVARSAERVPPFCAHFTRCGGCAVQHWQESAYRAWKRGLVETALRHRGLAAPVGALIDCHGAGRRRATLHVRFARERVLAGFMAARSHRLLDLDRCPILVAALGDAPRIARSLGKPFAGGAAGLDVQLTATETGLDCDLRGVRDLDLAQRQALADAASRLDLARVSLDAETLVERRSPVLRAGTVQVAVPPGSFLQATAAGEANLARLVAEAVAGARRIADLFCGWGPFALRLAETAAVHAVDCHEPSLAALLRAARGAAGRKPVTAAARDLVRDPLAPAELAGFDAVVLDPPRAGAEAQARMVARSNVATVVAIACDPASFARDAAILVAGGYRLEAVTPLDQFKWSAHVELVARFHRTKG